MITDTESATLFDLSYHWGTAFTFAVTDGVWQATCAATLEILQADNPHQLREQVRRYYDDLQARI